MGRSNSLRGCHGRERTYKNLASSSPDIDQFAGALSKKKATKGIFITTSTFTRDALASVREYASRIILIDGIKLADYMMDHNVVVSVTSTYEIKKVDSDFFEEDIE